jgi:glycosyltransferase involved in cell wall biosynthesis
LNGKVVEIIRNPIDWVRWRGARPVKETQPTILFVSRLQELKAPETLSRAFSIIRKSIPAARALFIGGSNKREGLAYAEWMKKTCGDNEGCQFVGQVSRDDLVRYLSESRVFVLPARYDNFSMAVIEAMAAGRPAVVSDQCGVAEFIRERGGGLVVPPDDPHALADCLMPFLIDEHYAAAMGETARRAVQQWLDPDVIAAARENVYRKAIELYRSQP